MERRVAIVGVGDVELEKGYVVGGLTELEIQAVAAKRALEDAGLTHRDVDGLFVTGDWGLPGPGLMMGVAVSDYLGLYPRYVDTSNIGGAAFEAMVGHAAAAIHAGYCQVALICYGSIQKSRKSRNLAGRPPVLMQQFETPFGLPSPIGGYALAATRYLHEFGAREEDLAEVAVNIRRWAELNPQATLRTPITVEDVLNSPMICSPLHLLDCCLVTDGGGAIVLTSAERARDCRNRPIWILGYGEAYDHIVMASMHDLTHPPAYAASVQAFSRAGIRPEDLEFAEIYDSFTITVMLTVEALGLCEKGQGWEFFHNGRTAPGGEFPINTNGGGLAYAHPGMYGIFLLIEAARQMWRRGGVRQIPKASLGVTAGTGGSLSSSAVVLLGVD
ncbi:MAG: thiolase [Sulfobacillus acidophilus]|uniref:Thiolase n=1 Tax=Sulfobacillus acidophilus TaxID=53633 RepID=A0A2T2WNB1_9FIRM|nr:MAG: thiolase [Sulfobacillus acidophilus]